jgi:hypothetical protein
MARNLSAPAVELGPINLLDQFPCGAIFEQQSAGVLCGHMGFYLCRFGLGEDVGWHEISQWLGAPRGVEMSSFALVPVDWHISCKL